MASIHIYTGPMGSEKTSNILARIHKYSNITKERVLLINFSEDNRSESRDGVSTHVYGDSSEKIPIGKYIDSVKVNILKEITDDIIGRYSVIGIDEAQFYPDLEEYIRYHSHNSNLTLYIAGLCFDSNNEPFGQVRNLLDIATTFEKLTAICSLCEPRMMSQASFTFATGKKPNAEVAIGGLDMYKPLCHRHYIQMKTMF